MILGRGSFVESFPLFGFELDQYETLFEEKLDLFVQLLAEQPVTWSGETRSALAGQQVYPRTESGSLTTWVGVGGSPNSVVRAAHHRLPLMLAIIGGESARFVPFVDLYHRALAEFGAPTLPVGVHSPGHIAETDELAREQLWPHMKKMRDRIGAERGWGPMTRNEFEQQAGPERLAVRRISGDRRPQDRRHRRRRSASSRFDLKYSAGELPHETMMRSIELYGTEVIPRVRELLADEASAADVVEAAGVS